jgi:hypothetical protein
VWWERRGGKHTYADSEVLQLVAPAVVRVVGATRPSLEERPEPLHDGDGGAAAGLRGGEDAGVGRRADGGESGVAAHVLRPRRGTGDDYISDDTFCGQGTAHVMSSTIRETSLAGVRGGEGAVACRCHSVRQAQSTR